MPVYEDVLASVRSIRKLKGIDDINVLLASWDDPRYGDRAYEVLDKALRHLQRIHDAVVRASGNDPLPEELCRRVLEDLGLPGMNMNPLIARSFKASLKVRDMQDLLKDQ